MAITVTDYQPGETDALDTYLDGANATTNYATSADLVLRSSTTLSQILIRFDWILTLYGKKIKLVSPIELELYCHTKGTNGTNGADVCYILRNWVESQATYNIFSTGNNWQTAGALGALDKLKIYSITPSGTEIGGTGWYTFYIDGSILETLNRSLYYGIGILVPSTSGADNSNAFASSSNATAANRPKYTFSYEPSNKLYLMDGYSVDYHTMHSRPA